MLRIQIAQTNVFKQITLKARQKKQAKLLYEKALELAPNLEPAQAAIKALSKTD